jgi:hypothetical protein
MTARAAPGGPPCQLGMLASLRRVQPEEVGRIVLVSCTADPVVVPGTETRLPAWRVFVMGAPVVIDDEERSHFIVAECCLQALCRLPLPTARTLYLAQAQREADEAVAALGQWLAAHPMDEHELDAEIKSAAREAIARHRAPAVLLPIG